MGRARGHAGDPRPIPPAHGRSRTRTHLPSCVRVRAGFVGSRAQAYPLARLPVLLPPRLTPPSPRASSRGAPFPSRSCSAAYPPPFYRLVIRILRFY